VKVEMVETAQAVAELVVLAEAEGLVKLDNNLEQLMVATVVQDLPTYFEQVLMKHEQVAAAVELKCLELQAEQEEQVVVELVV
jgi:hypothetical protein